MRAFTLILPLLFASVAYAQDPWLGQKLMPRYGAKFMAGSHQVPEQEFNLPLVVRDVKGEWLEVGPGYIHKSDTVPLADATAYYSDYLKKNPGSSWAFNSRGNAWQAKGDFDAALKDYNEAIRLDSKNAAAYNNRGNAWQAKGDFAAALKDYAKAIRLDPSNVDAYNNRSRLLSTTPDDRIRDGKQAVEDAEKACKLTGWEDPVLFDTLAAAYAEVGNFAKAVEWQTKAVEMAPAKAKDECNSRLELYRSKKPYRQ